MFCLRYLCLFTFSGVQHILCCVFDMFVSVLCTLCCQFLWTVHFLIAPSVFSNIYLFPQHCYRSNVSFSLFRHVAYCVTDFFDVKTALLKFNSGVLNCN